MIEDVGSEHKRANLISPSQLAALLNEAPSERGIKIIDASWYSPSDDGAVDGEGTALQDYLRERIPGALFFDHDQVADFNSPLPQATPSADRFAACVGKLGISREDRVVVYESCVGFESAPRAWFLFKLYGHADVKVLEGGLPAWASEGYSIERGTAGECLFLELVE